MVYSRRALLGALAGTAAAAGLAGCGFLGNGDGDSTSPPSSRAPSTTAPGGSSTAPPATSPAETATQEPTSTAPPPADDGVTGYPRWLADPRIFDQSHYHFVALRPARILANKEAYEGTATLDQIVNDGTPGLTMAEAEGVYLLNKRLTDEQGLNFCQIVEGGIEPDPVIELLTDRFKLEERGDYGGFTLFRRKNLLGAVSDDDFVLFQSSGGMPVLKEVVETSRGTAPRYGTDNPDVATVVDALGTEPEVVYGRSNEPGQFFPGDVAKGAGWRATDGSLDFDATVVFENEDAAETGPVRTWLDGASPVAGADEVVLEPSGRAITISASVDPGTVSALQPNWRAEDE